MRAREIKKKKVDEGVLDSLQNVYKTSTMGQQRQANATTKAAETKFSLNLATLIARAIQSGSVTTPVTPPPPPLPESRHYQIFDTLVEALIDEVAPPPPPTIVIKRGSITKLVKSYVDQLVRQYNWKNNPGLKTHSNQLAGQIETAVSTNLNNILAAKGAAMIPAIQKVAATPIDQLFSTMYQWEQTGQNGGGRQSSSDRPPDAPRPSGEKISATNVTPADLEAIDKIADFLKRAAASPTIFDDERPDFERYKDAIKKLAAGL